MFLSRLRLNLRCREARRDLSNPYQLHSTLCRAFSPPETKCPKGEFLWRLEPETDSSGYPRIIVQSRNIPDWGGVGVNGWIQQADPAIDLKERLKLDLLKAEQRFRFRLRANPCVTKNGKRLGLLKQDEQEKWLKRKGAQHGFCLPEFLSFDYYESSEDRIDVRISQEQMLSDKQHSDNSIRVFSVLYDGILTITEPEMFKIALKTGIGHGKVMGLGLLSVVPIF
ncbi:type I-E CRISPR-associated protein Cas6/Cse3/CasE [Pelobacter propionicus]|uniref:CRISPR-associated protein, Cse3 family n=1 Tax=Pelobacter propionicus (strain DSM 2379 / NBRC 103807 / OttBd1) TaxID=338966 RepID=A1ARH5_PELPD|nr:type I-E CRISPR-associated protein Cas6/Cse3/CasE [Pelobacter propionicus]ABK99945.1 CRISPR-associated protein, Cse3 family [Pelobacter propionicus DSM 2379]